MSSVSNISNRRNPFPGLRPFNMDEREMFFGREGESGELLGKLLRNRFLSVIGASGSGKTSLINCALIPGLKGMDGFGESDPRVILFRPGNDPVSNLTDTLYGELVSSGIKKADRSRILSVIKGNPEGIVSILKDIAGPENKKILLVVDQFEELFRYSALSSVPGTTSQASTLINVLTSAISQTSTEVYEIIAMRSDLISECSHYKVFTQLINNSNFVIPRMSRENYRDVIEKPVIKSGATIDAELVEALLDDIGEQPDSLPVLQHALMRTWERWQQLDQPARPLTLADYRSIGTLNDALSRHGDEIYQDLDENGRDICEKLFKTITGKGNDNRGVRRPLSFSSILSILQCSPDELKSVIEKFRTSSTSFIIPGPALKVDESSIIDLSHESLIHLWDRLKTWVDEEASSVKMYLLLSEASALFQQGKTGLLKQPDLQLAVKWRNTFKPTLDWARRYNPAFERAMVYLRTSEKEFRESEDNRNYLNRRKARRNRIIAGFMGIAAILASLFMIYAFILKTSADRRREDAERESREFVAQKTAAEKYAATALRRSIEADSAAAVINGQVMVTRELLAQSDIQLSLIEKEAAAERNMRLTATRHYDSVRQVQSGTDRNLKIALSQKNETQRQRMLAVARSMSLRSLKTDEPVDLRTLLAYQAYIFNKRNQGSPNDADIYQGLYQIARQTDNKYTRTFTGHTGEIKGIAFVPGKNQFFTSGTDGKVIKWDLDDREKSLQIIYANGDIIDVLAISPDAGWLACGGQNASIRMIPVKGNDIGYELKGHTGKIKSLIFSYDGEYLYSAALDGKVLKWDLSAKTSTDLTTDKMKITSIDLSSDGQHLAGISGDGGLLIWNPENNADRFTIAPGSRIICSVRFRPMDNKLAVGYNNGDVEVWDIENRKALSETQAHNNEITNIRFNGKRQQMATASRDGTLKLWETDDMTIPPVTLNDNGGLVMAIEFSPDGQMIISGSYEENINLKARPVSADLLAEGICPGIKRNFTVKEWMAYVGRDIEYEETCEGVEYNITIKEIK